MAFDSISTLKKNRVYAPMITGLAIIVAIFVARPGFAAYNEAKLQLITTETTLSEQQAKLQKLENNANLIADANSELAKKVQKISKDFNTSEIMETIMINQFATLNATSGMTKPLVNITNITLDKGSKEPNGLYYGTANMTITAANAGSIATFLDYLTTNTPYAFNLSDITLPMATGVAPTQNASNESSVSVTLGLYYYP